MGFTALALISAGLLLGQANTTSAQQPARPPVVWVQPILLCAGPEQGQWSLAA